MLKRDIFGSKPNRKSVKQRHYDEIQLLELGFSEDLSTEDQREEKKERYTEYSDLIEQKETLKADDYWINLQSSFTKLKSEFASLESPTNSNLLQRALRRKSRSDSRPKFQSHSRRKALSSDNSRDILNYAENTTLSNMLSEINRGFNIENNKKKSKHTKNRTAGSFFLLNDLPSEIPSRAQRQKLILRPKRPKGKRSKEPKLRYADLHIRSVHNRFNRPLPKMNLQQMRRLGVGDIRRGDIIFIVDYEEPNRRTFFQDSRKKNSRKSKTRISKSKVRSNLINYPSDFVLDLHEHSSTKRKFVTNIPELSSTDAQKPVKPNDTVRARHVMICTNASQLKSVIEVE